jgi:type IV fimbrial biogenesis protein FimT
MHIPTQRQQGVTLIELLVTMSILVILLTVGVGGMTTVVKRNARATEVNSMVGHLNFARAQAVLRVADIVVCPVDTTDLDAGCQGGTKDWVNGYAVIREDNGEVLRVEEGSRSITIRSSLKVFRFFDDGTFDNVAGANITFCDVDAGSSNAVPPRVIIVSSMGRVRVSERTGSNNVPKCP